jgi:Kdo2-lipid IVA lauroyltransferase/acyltransferase
MYYLVYGFLYLISLLPRFVLYGIGDGISWLIYNVVGYRKKVVLDNLRIAFPEKTEPEREKIARQFYRNFVESFIETIMLLSMSDEKVAKMFAGDVAIINEIAAKGNNIQLHAIHQFNWEVLNINVAKNIKNITFLGVYMPISNAALDRIFINLRTRGGTKLIPATDFKSNFLTLNYNPYLLGLAADQSPATPKNAYWVNFFGRPTAFVTGPEKAARLRSTAVVFVNFYKIKRGVYTLETELITHNASLLPVGELTIRYVRFIEETIRKRPDNYLWSHRRWKHAYKPEYAENVLEPLNIKP